MGNGAGDPPLTYQGAYDATRTYLPRQVVTSGSSVYMAVATTAGHTPTASEMTPWLPLGGAGDTGDVISTIGAGLPSLLTRALGDLHFNVTTRREHVITGVVGSSYPDTFDTVASGANINGRAVAGAGNWSADLVVVGTGGGALFKNDGVNTTFRGGTLVIPAGGSSNMSVAADTIWPSLGSSNCLVRLILRGNSASNGYTATATAYDGVHLQITLDRAGVNVAGGSGSLTPPVTAGSTHTLSCEIVGNVISVFWDGLLILSYTDPSVLTGSTTTLNTMGFDIGTGANIGSWIATALGTLAWSPTSGIYQQAVVKPGAAAVAANVMPPGLRIPINCVLTAAYIDVGTAPTGSALTVLVKRSGTTVATVTVAAGTTSGSSTGLSFALLKGELLTFDITTVGSTVAGSDVLAGVEAY